MFLCPRDDQSRLITNIFSEIICSTFVSLNLLSPTVIIQFIQNKRLIMPHPIWSPNPTRVATANITRFRKEVSDQWSVALTDNDALWRFSIEEREKFWESVCKFASLSAKTWGGTVLKQDEKLSNEQWFPSARLNFAENLLRYRGNQDALVFRGEDKVERRLSRDELYRSVSCLVQAFRKAGLTKKDRVGAYISNIPEAVIGMLACASLGATWSSCSPDFGVDGVIERFGQIKPKILITIDGYFYNGKRIDIRSKIRDIIKRLPSVQKVIVVPYSEIAPDISSIKNAKIFSDFVRGCLAKDIDYEYVPFNHPLYILYSSGTTGKPKCIVHGGGGILLKHTVEHTLSTDVKEGDRIFWFTTCGWMMWNWIVSGLAFGATILLYDGSPFYPNGNIIYDFAEAERMTLLGTSAKFIDACKKAALSPKNTHDLATLKCLGSTGSTLAPEAFDYIYEHIKTDLHLQSMSGGTDIAGCFCGGDPTRPVWRGEIQTPTLGMAIDVYDQNGQSMPSGKGELVCTKSFPTVPKFLNDSDNVKLTAAYFKRFPKVWTHGDFVEWTDTHGLIIHGRSDATLNPGGVRIGTAEIYRQVEKLDEVLESIVIGQDWKNDVRIVLFVVLREGNNLDDKLITKIKHQIRINCTPRHIPARILRVSDIPRTKSGKITELSVRDIIHGREISNKEALANPDVLNEFQNRKELEI